MDIETFNQHRPLLFSVAYRMILSVMDAEDTLQEAFLRWQHVSSAEVDAPKAYLSAVVTRLCIDHLRSARVQREQYVGPWLPEPLIAEQAPDPADTSLLHESLSMAFLVLLESLNPTERAVFLLHDVFGYDFAEVARIVGKSEANCRQIARRAREYIMARRPRFDPSLERQRQLTREFAQACASGNMEALLEVLAEDIVLWSDGGGKARAARRPIHGATAVARFLLGVLDKSPPGLAARLTHVNGQPGIIAHVDDHIVSVLTLDIVDGRIQAIHIVVNPDKLQGIRL